MCVQVHTYVRTYECDKIFTMFLYVRKLCRNIYGEPVSVCNYVHTYVYISMCTDVRICI